MVNVHQWQMQRSDTEGLLHTVADPSHILRIRGVPNSPVVHLDTSIGVLGLPNSVHEDVYGALCWLLNRAIQDRHPQHHAPARLACVLILPQHGLLAVVLGLPVEVRRVGRAIGFVRRLALGAGEHVVRRDIDEQDGPRSADFCERSRGRNVQSSSPFRIGIAFIWEAVCGACGRSPSAMDLALRGKRCPRELTMHHDLRS